MLSVILLQWVYASCVLGEMYIRVTKKAAVPYLYEKFIWYRKQYLADCIDDKFSNHPIIIIDAIEYAKISCYLLLWIPICFSWFAEFSIIPTQQRTL